MSSLSVTTLAAASRPPAVIGTMEHQIQERNRRIQKLQEERQKQRLQSVFLHEVRIQSLSEIRKGNASNNNTVRHAAAPFVKKAASAKLPTTSSSSPSQASRIKRSKSAAGVSAKKPTKKITNPSKEAAVPTTSASARKASTTTISRKVSASRNLSSISTRKLAGSSSILRNTTFTGLRIRRKHSATSRKLSKFAIRATSSHKLETKKSKSKDAMVKSTSSVAGSLVQVKASKSKAKVTFSKTNVANSIRKDFYCPVTTPISILKNRKKIDALCRSTIKLSKESKENLIRARAKNSSKKESNELKEMSTMASTRVASNEFPMAAPQPNIPTCTAFPGTKEWEKYWIKFNDALEKYHKDMNEYEKQGNRLFRDDLALYRKEAKKLAAEKEIFNNLGSKGIEMGLIPPPPIVTKELKGLQLFNGYIMKSKSIKGTVSNLPGSPKGIRFEVDIKGYDPDKILIEKDHNLLTVSIEHDRFLRIGTPTGKSAGDIEVWPPIDGVMIIDAP